MRFSHRSAPTLALVAAPLLVAATEMNLLAAFVLVSALLLWRWLIVLSVLTEPSRGPELRLETISASHFVEKVRWCLDRLGEDYREIPDAGALGVFFTGRTVPRLRVRTGSVSSVIGNSPDILRYLWGRFAFSAGERAEFLRPRPDAVELEQKLDRYGVDLQRWIYYHILSHREITLRAWGAEDPRLPVWQRYAVIALFPLLRRLMRRAFRLGTAAHARVVARIEALLSDLETRLSDGRRAILGGDQADFADITVAALSGLWLQPPEYGRGEADSLRLRDALRIPALEGEVDRWRSSYPRLVEHVERLYREERGTPGPGRGPGSGPR